MDIHVSKATVFEPGRLSLSIAAVALLLAWTPASAAESDDFDRFSLSLGVFVTDRNTDTRLDGDIPDSGSDVDLENDLGFANSSSVFRVDGYFRFNEAHRLDFSAFDLSRNASKQLERDIEWNGEIYPVDVLVEASLDLNIYKLAYTWSFLRREQGYIGASLGLYVADIGTSIAADSLGLSSSSGLTAPLPVIGLRGQYDFAEKWSLRASAEIFAVDYDQYTGNLHDLYAGVDYQFTDTVAFGLGINSVALDVGVDKANFAGDLNWKYDGALLFVKFDF